MLKSMAYIFNFAKNRKSEIEMSMVGNSNNEEYYRGAIESLDLIIAECIKFEQNRKPNLQIEESPKPVNEDKWLR